METEAEQQHCAVCHRFVYSEKTGFHHHLHDVIRAKSLLNQCLPTAINGLTNEGLEYQGILELCLPIVSKHTHTYGVQSCGYYRASACMDTKK